MYFEKLSVWQYTIRIFSKRRKFLENNYERFWNCLSVDLRTITINQTIIKSNHIIIKLKCSSQFTKKFYPPKCPSQFRWSSVHPSRMYVTIQLGFCPTQNVCHNVHTCLTFQVWYEKCLIYIFFRPKDSNCFNYLNLN